MVGGALTAADLLVMDPEGEHCFRARNNQHNFMGATFGGQVLCQALAAAHRTVAGWPAHNCSGLFLRSGKPDEPIEYRVEVVRDGRRFAARRVLAVQAGKPIFDMLCSFHHEDGGPSHQAELAEAVPPPEALLNLQEFHAANADRFPPAQRHIYGADFPVELRLAEPENVFFGQTGQTRRRFWLRMPSAVGLDGVAQHQSLLAFMSDYWFASVAGAPYRSAVSSTSPTVSIASLNHSLWFHGDVRADEWLLFMTESPWAGYGRGLARGLVYNLDGKLVASASQEVMLNRVPSASGSVGHAGITVQSETLHP